MSPYEHDVPTPEELSARYLGLTFAEFKLLDDEQVEEHRTRYNDQVARTPLWEDVEDETGQPESQFTDEGVALHEAGKVLGNFMKWRKYGIPDREVSYDDLKEYLQHYLKLRQEKDPEYGIIPRALTEGWSADDIATTKEILRYCYHMRRLDEPPIIDTYSLGNTIGLDDDLLAAMIEKKVLIPHGNGYEGPYGKHYDRYFLARPYLDRYLTTVITWSTQD